MYSVCLCVLFFVSVNGVYENSSAQLGLLQSAHPCTDSNHLLLAPGSLAASSSTRVCLSRFYTQGSVHLTLTLTTEDGRNSSVNKELGEGDGGCIDFLVPQQTNTNAELSVQVRYPAHACAWSSSSTLRISSSRLVLLAAERGRYRPGDLVKLRVTALKSDLTPVHAAIEDIWLEGPAGSWGDGARVAQWSRVRSRFGMAQVQYRLEQRAPVGQWRARARLADGSQGTSEFWVGDYKLPPFQLTVKHAAKVLRTSDRLVWTVCVRYPWSEAVEGILVIRLRSAGSSGANSGGVRTAVLLRSPRACHRHAAAARRVGLGAADVVIADFSFQEEGTGIWQNTTVVSQVVDQPASLEIVSKQLAVIVPGLPYKIKIKATRWDSRPALNEIIKICRNPTNTFEVQPSSENSLHEDLDIVCDEATTDARGVARVTFLTGYEGQYKFYKFVATLKNNTEVRSEPLYLPVRRSGVSNAAFGTLVGDARAPGARVFMPLYLNLRNVKRPITVHFVVTSRGGTIYRWGATAQCPTSTNDILTAPRDTHCNTDMKPVRNASESSEMSRLLKVMIPVRVSHQMCPESHLVAYFYFGGELVSASKRLEVEECFVNKVETTWLSRQVAPGSSASLSITTSPSSLCALSALDVASKWLQDPGPSMRESLMSSLARVVAASRNVTGAQAIGECFYSQTPEAPSSSLDLAVAWLAEAGLRVLGEVARRRSCEGGPPAPLTTDMVPRSDFLESWLWRLVVVGSNGSAVVTSPVPDSITRFEASVFCVSRSGVAISQPAVLQVFREFFIHADAPQRLRRGDATVLRYRIFNYLYEPLAVQIQILADPHLEILSSITETACIAGRASIARRTEARARLEGKGRVSVRAIAVTDRRCGNYSGAGVESRVSDEVVLQIAIDHEGVPTREHRSALLCGRDTLETSDYKVEWKWSKANIVPGTESVRMWAVGDLTGPLLADADALVLLPRGCGEQNLARLATNLLALTQLDPRSAAAAAAKDHVARGFARQLQYAHPSGGFSAWGPADAAPSTWLTAFAVRYMRRAHQVLSPGSPSPAVLDRAERWLLGQQMENGCFRNEGQVFHRELKGGLGKEGETASVALTAYVITSLLEGYVALPARVVGNSLSCLRAMPPLKTKTSTGVYAHALLAYAYTRLRKYEASIQRWNSASALQQASGLQVDEEVEHLTELMKIARRHAEIVFWETGSLSTSIEATGYALLALAECPARLRASCVRDAAGARAWLQEHRNAEGGFLSTQDTLVALEALSSWSLQQPHTSPNLTVTARVGSQLVQPALGGGPVAAGGGEGATVEVEGAGCALVQATRYYHAWTPDAKGDVLSVQVSVQPEGPFDCDKNGTFCFCAAVVEACVVWADAFPEMALLEVSLPGGYGADASRLYAQMDQPRTLIRRIELSPSGGRVSLYLGSRDGGDVTSGAQHQCYQLHAAGPRAATRPAHARVYDYYNPTVNDTQMYTIPADCPPRIAHTSKTFINSDNLYQSARSLDDDELIISEDFTYEDIPEGIPLEDPFYDNLQMSEGISLVDEPRTVEREIDDGTAVGDEEDKAKDVELIKVDKPKSDEENEIAQASGSKYSHFVEATDIIGGRNSEDLKTEEKKHNQNLSTFHATDEKKSDDFKTEETKDNSNLNEFQINNKKKDDLKSEESKHPSTLSEHHVIESNKSHIIKTQANENNSTISEFTSLDKNNNNSKTDEKNDQNKNKESEEDLNPNLSDFHVIDREADLAVPTGMEGPVPQVVLPPPGFVETGPRGKEPPSPSYLKGREVAEYRQSYTPLYYVFEYPFPVYLSPPRYYRSTTPG